MRLSSDPCDATYLEWKRLFGAGHRIDVFLDGDLVQEVNMADEEEGEVRVLRRNEYGDVVVDKDHLLTETLTGKVKIFIGDK